MKLNKKEEDRRTEKAKKFIQLVKAAKKDPVQPKVLKKALNLDGYVFQAVANLALKLSAKGIKRKGERGGVHYVSA